MIAAMGSSVLLWLAVLVPGSAALLAGGRLSEVGRLARRLSPVGAFYFVYSLLIGYSERPAVAVVGLRHAEGIVTLERRLHIFWEPGLSHHPLPWATGFYGWAQVGVTLGVLTWCAVNESDSIWRLARNSLAFIAAGGFLVFWLYPVSPPWLLPHTFGVSAPGLRGLTGIGDLVGAMPSLHTAWAGWAACMLWALLPYRLRFLGFVHLALTAAVVLTTGNHFVLDVVAGECLAVVSMGLSDRLERSRRRAESRELVISQLADQPRILR
jgi:hypothetical protein